MPERRPIWIAAALVLLSVLVLAVAACGGDSNGGGESEGGKKMIAGVEANDHGEKAVSGQSEVEVELDDDYFEPTVLKGTPGQKITLELKNEGGTEHNLSIADQNIDQDVEPDEDAKVEVTFPQSGELSFVCKYHESAGMAGALVVS